MFLAIAVLLIQPNFVPQLSFSAEKAALNQPVAPDATSSAAANEESLPLPLILATLSTAAPLAQPIAVSNVSTLPDAPVPNLIISTITPVAYINAGSPLTVSVDELRAENRKKDLMWKGLLIASSGAATFDAWSTRNAITNSGAQELDPMLKPFAGNASLYAAIQVGPALMDFVGKKMMYNRRAWVRRMWWIPQSASFVSSVFCGAHNVSYQ